MIGEFENALGFWPAFCGEFHVGLTIEGYVCIYAQANPFSKDAQDRLRVHHIVIWRCLEFEIRSTSKPLGRRLGPEIRLSSALIV